MKMYDDMPGSHKDDSGDTDISKDMQQLIEECSQINEGIEDLYDILKEILNVLSNKDV